MESRFAMRRVLASERKDNVVIKRLPTMPKALKSSTALLASHLPISMPPFYHKLNTVGNVPLGVDQQVARQADDPLIRPATSRGRQVRFGVSGDVDADDGEVAIFQFPNVGAAITGDALRAVGVRVRANAFREHTNT